MSLHFYVPRLPPVLQLQQLQEVPAGCASLLVESLEGYACFSAVGKLCSSVWLAGEQTWSCFRRSLVKLPSGQIVGCLTAFPERIPGR